MSTFRRFLRDHIFFTVMYMVPVAIIIMFYSIVMNSDEIVYPICIAVFFYLAYMFVRLILYIIHNNNLKRLQNNSVSLKTNVKEYQAAYDALNMVHASHNAELSRTEIADRESERFISACIHNLKTPVTVIDILLQRVRKGEIDEKEALDQIEEEKNRLVNNLNMLLDVQRITELQNDYQPHALNLDEELQRIINNNKRLFINSKVYPKFNVNSNYVYTDVKWNEVLINQIISNGVKYSTGDEQKHMYFTIENAGKFTRLIIRDEGMGIPEYDLPKIFEAFYTGTNGRTGHSSSGIGLYLCKQICDKLGHSIKIENDNGCKVTISYLTKA